MYTIHLNTSDSHHATRIRNAVDRRCETDPQLSGCSVAVETHCAFTDVDGPDELVGASLLALTIDMLDDLQSEDESAQHLRQVQQHALAVAPDPGPDHHWRADEDSLDVDLMYGDELIAWIELTSNGWRPRLAGSEYNGCHRTLGPRVAMLAVLDALEEEA